MMQTIITSATVDGDTYLDLMLEPGRFLIVVMRFTHLDVQGVRNFAPVETVDLGPDCRHNEAVAAFNAKVAEMKGDEDGNDVESEIQSERVEGTSDVPTVG